VVLVEVFVDLPVMLSKILVKKEEKLFEVLKAIRDSIPSIDGRSALRLIRPPRSASLSMRQQPTHWIGDPSWRTPAILFEISQIALSEPP
jgi:hypothetical protein